jgi:hypothetical protein
VIGDYAYALTLLDRYDHGTLAIKGTTRKSLHVIYYDEAIRIVVSMKGEFDGLFGIEKDQGFKSALGAIYQTFGGEELYTQEQMAEVCGGGLKGFARYESGQVMQSRGMDNMLRILDEFPHALDLIKRRPAKASAKVAAG